ncbi:flavin monoamine oxidase family protein [Kaistella polysaccharea]|uniref:flavin monoamine oxidase family protein n=1 Tax=Kaistella polysaccharea TaxID=2878534 RepID=UPI001CF52CA2|nr:NAD(P)/FAD-dependent oxidoreductase [Kaistella polysaccharea]
MIIIIGAGLSGLLTAYRLNKAGIAFKVLEARSRLGGRINTVFGSEDTPVEMGATWFSSPHTNLISLLNELGLEYFEQHMDEAVFLQQNPQFPVQKMQIPKQQPSYRISGGTSKLIETLYKNLEVEDVLFNQAVEHIHFQNHAVQIIADDTFIGTHVVLAIPPKLWAKIDFEPKLPSELLAIAAQTHTWMEDSIKIALTYARPFWRDENIPATFFSNSGPVTEFYDHCNHERSKYALCGFMSSNFKNLNSEERRNLVMKQLKNVFGIQAEGFLDYQECIWSREEYTFSSSSYSIYPHQNNGNPIFSPSYFEDRMVISSSESSAEFPGYMDGAVYSGNLAAEKLISASQK